MVLDAKCRMCQTPTPSGNTTGHSVALCHNARVNLEVYRAQQTGNAEKIAIATKKMEAAEDNAAIARKTALATQSDFYAKKKLLEATATKQSTAPGTGCP